MSIAFSPGDNSSMKASFEKKYDTDGRVYVYAVAHGALTAKTPYKIICDEYGPITAALADDTNYYYVGVPELAVASGGVGKLYIGGEVDDVITPSLSVSVGHAFSFVDGAVADAGADYSGAAGQFAVCRTVSTSSTTQDMLLVPERIIGTT